MKTDSQLKSEAPIMAYEMRVESEAQGTVSETEALSEGLVVRDLNAWYGSFQALRGVSLLVPLGVRAGAITPDA